ncbi:hypothetical protein J4G37_52570, partial [Microvirga sp. 3-52]|nr:hypothetical protein [Microvirga sp. 3-52]
MQDAVELERIKETLHQNATRQIELVNWMIENAGKTIPAKSITDELGIQGTVIKALIERGAATEEYEEVYREPEAPGLKDVAIPVHLTDEQEIALDSISTSIKNEKPETFLLHGVTGSGK